MLTVDHFGWGGNLQANGIDVNIWTFGYNSPPFEYSAQGIPRLYPASNLLEYLEIENIGDIAAAKLRQPPFIFVTHTIGGLVVKEVIRIAQSFNQSQAIIKQVPGIVF